MSYTNISVSFDSVELTSINGLSILATNGYKPAKRNITIASLARTNKAKVSSGFYDKREIVVRINLVAKTRDLMEVAIDQLMTILQGLEKDLIVRQSGGSRKYTATYTDANILQEGGAYFEAELIFETSDHFGYDLNPTLLVQTTNFTSGNKTDSFTVGGSAPFQLPTIKVTLSSVTGGTSKYVTIGNGANGMAVTITRTWSSGDLIEISAPNQTVKVNGVEVAFTGAIPEFAVGIGYLTYNDNFTARTMSNTTTYVKRYV